MLYKKEEEFARALKSGAAGSPYLLYGGEEYLVGLYRKSITKRFRPGEADVVVYDGQKPDMEQLSYAVDTYPLMGGERCVVIQDLQLGKLPANQLKTLLEILGDVPDFCTLVITGTATGFDPRSAAAKKVIKACEAAGSAVELGLRPPSGMAQFLKNVAKKNGCQLSTELAKLILRTCEADMGVLAGETAKICAYAGGGEITQQHIEAVAIPRVEARVFDLGKAILAGNPQRAMEILQDLFYLREQPVAVLGTLVLSFVDLYRARTARECGKTPADVVAAFGYKGREFRVQNAFSSRVSAHTLRLSLNVLWDCDRKMKSSSVDDKILLEQTVTRLLLLQGGG